jgi:hypothetical protein
MSEPGEQPLHSEKTTGLVRIGRPMVEAGLVFIWFIYLVQVLTGQDYNGSVNFDLFLARVGGPTGSHATSYLIFLSIFPIALVMLGSIIPAFLVEALAFEIHEGLWQVPYYIVWHSMIDPRIWVVENTLGTAATVATVAILMIVYRLPARFFVVVTVAWGFFLSGWLALGFPVSVLSKLPDFQVMPSVYSTVLWVNQVEFLGWLYFASVLLICLQYFRMRQPDKSIPSADYDGRQLPVCAPLISLILGRPDGTRPEQVLETGPRRDAC